MSYIKKEPLCAWLSNMRVSENIIKTIESDIRFPPADVVEVVRCGECKWWHSGGCAFRKDSAPALPSADDYCSHGERKYD